MALLRRQLLAGVVAIGVAGQAGMSQAQRPEEFPSRPPLGAGEDAALGAARDWLQGALVHDIRAFALGEERRWFVDQDARTLSLEHADQLRLTLDAQLLASFNPRNGTFRWAWSNSSVEPAFARASAALRRHTQTSNFPSFSAPIFRARFEDCHALVALAARTSGFAGVYRAITSDHVSVFLGYSAPAEADVARVWQAGRASAQDEGDALQLVDAYDAAMLPFDAQYNELLGPLGPNIDQNAAQDAVMERLDTNAEAINRISRRQDEVHRQFWRRADNYWTPSLQWPSPHDRERRSAFVAVSRRAGGVYVIRGYGGTLPDAFVLQRFDDGMRIVDLDLDWGAGLLIQ